MLGSLGWRGKALAFKGNRINPGTGLKRIFGVQGVIELGKSIAKVLLLGGIGYWLVAKSLPAFMMMASTDLNAAIGLAGRAVGHAMLALAGGLVIIARSEEHTSALQSLMRISYAVFCLKKKKTHI